MRYYLLMSKLVRRYKFTKSPLTPLCQRGEKLFPLWKRGIEGDFKNIKYNAYILISFVYVLAILCISINAYAGEMRPPGKPRSPLQITISPVQSGLLPSDIKLGDVVEFKIVGKTHVETEKLDIRVELLGGVELVSGETSWIGAAKKGEDKALLITVRAPKHGNGRIRARVSVPQAGGAAFAVETEYRLGAEPDKKPATMPEIKRDNRGREIREYRIK